ncbi:HAD-superfamily hydrolase [Parathielavia appendiculata]|uniref:HAD-superfamily hydrolase n=1 Tax=Parathielavia appendiculata TaxID=2587402 RepID=A0AAN6Z4E5_9PEZI|nr:HAD-superfamily hydrolase [Parathielavia appendiculata]
MAAAVFCRSSLRGLTASLSSRTAAAFAPALSSRAASVARRCWIDDQLSRRRRRVAGSTRRFSSDVHVGRTGREPPSFAFAFDIDGVLLHVAKPIPGAPEVLKFLDDNNIPFILLTNGGGKHETERVKDLGDKLGVQLSTDNFVQSHTPFRELLEGPDNLRDKTVLVTGSDYEKCRAIFHEYGFKNVITPADIYSADPTIFPFQSPKSYTTPSQPLPRPLYNETAHPISTTTTASTFHSHLKVDAIFVLNDPRDWALDIQVITDLLLSHAGYAGTYSPLNNNPSVPNFGWQRDGQPPLYFSNADLFWSAGYHLPRFGQGAFQAALAGIWRRITGGRAELERVCIGKPYGETYRFAERLLGKHRREVLREIIRMGHHQAGKEEEDLGPGPVGPLRTVYMVGDNPESDIAGANRHISEGGTEWVSVLVRTGVWSEARGGRLEGEFTPREVVDDVAAAVKWALKREGWAQGEGGRS